MINLCNFNTQSHIPNIDLSKISGRNEHSYKNSEQSQYPKIHTILENPFINQKVKNILLFSKQSPRKNIYENMVMPVYNPNYDSISPHMPKGILYHMIKNSIY